MIIDKCVDNYGEFKVFKNEDLMIDPEISVVMSVLNGEVYLKESVESILNQTIKNFEFIIINDGSTDKSNDILMKYLLSDNRIILIQQENIGLTKSLNRGIKIARGKYIARQDADDASSSDRLERLFAIANEVNADIVASRAYINDGPAVPPTRVIKNFRLSILMFYNIFVHGTLFFRTRILKDLLYDEFFKYAQDYELILRMLKNKCSIFITEGVLYKLNKHNNSLSLTKNKEQNYFARLACEKYFGSSIFFISNKKIIMRGILRILREIYIFVV